MSPDRFLADPKAIRRIVKDETPPEMAFGTIKRRGRGFVEVELFGSTGHRERVIVPDQMPLSQLTVGKSIVCARPNRSSPWVALSTYSGLDRYGRTAKVADSVGVDSSAPSQVANLTVTGKPGYIEVRWDSHQTQDPVAYEVQSDDDGSGEGTLEGYTRGSYWFYSDTVGTTKHFRVRAISKIGKYGAWTAYSSATVLTEPPDHTHLGDGADKGGLLQGAIFDGNVDFGQHEADQFVMDQGTSFPGSPVEGQQFYRTDLDVVYVYDGAAWDPVGTTVSWSQVRTVMKTGGNHTSIAAAMAAITDAGASKPYTVLLGPGIHDYTADETWKDYVSIVGMGREASVINLNSATADVNLIPGSHASYQDFTIRATLTPAAAYTNQIVLIIAGQSDLFWRNIDIDVSLTQVGQTNVSGIYMTDQGGDLSDIIFEHVRSSVIGTTTNASSASVGIYISTDGVTLIDCEGYGEVGSGASAGADAYGLQIGMDDAAVETVEVYGGEYHSANGSGFGAGVEVTMAGAGSSDVICRLFGVYMHSDEYGLNYSCADNNHYLYLFGCTMEGTTQDIHQYSGVVDVWPYVYGCHFDRGSVDGDWSELNYLDGDRAKAYQPDFEDVGIKTDLINESTSGATVSIGDLLTLEKGPELTIAAGEITVTHSYHEVDTQGDDPADDLDTINGGVEGSILVLQQVIATRDVTVKDGAGNIELDGGADFNLTNARRRIVLLKASTNWLELSRSSN